jgi:heme oxygenase
VTVDILQRLKEETAEAHRQVEERVPVFRPGFSLDEYGTLLERFYGFWAPLESRLSRLASLEDAELDLEGRLKSSLLEEDLRFLGHNPESVRQCDALPAVDTFLRGLGCLYVLEGSTLGSRFIARRLEESLHLQSATGASFFNSYGESVGRRWTEFRSFVAERVKPEDGDEIVSSARQTFQCFYEWLPTAS